ncbi:MAG: ABC-F family ATP-binding cassette domain-containing protein [Pseudomonadaceae bacterium]|nr:ABC-F family ATP-binding cassette domain-containing protein [Pseudomonadaceae bacterium]
MLRLTDIVYRRDETAILDGLSMAVHDGQRVGIVGRNGCGKSTLLALIRGAAQAESGEVNRPRNWRLAYMAQETEAQPISALDFVLDGHREFRRLQRLMESADGLELAELNNQFEAIDGYRVEVTAREVLSGLGFTSDEFAKAHASFSGGWRIRLSLARTLLQPSELMLLDEPTNHLDVRAISWLEGYLARYPGTLLVVAHERDFLDNIASHIVHVSHGQARTYRGNYSTFETVYAQELANNLAARERQDKVRKDMEAFISRFRAKASKAKQAQSRIKAMEKMTLVAPMQAERGYNFSFLPPAKISTPLLSMNDVSFGYDANTPIVQGVNQSILPGARIALIGDNGAGKTTVLRSLAGELPELSGEIVRGQHCETAYFAQDQMATLNLTATPLAMFAKLNPDQREQQQRDYLGGWGFGANALSRPISTLSGGEKARLVLAKLARQEPALLILDEPSNHLDMDMRAALLLAIQRFEGAVVLVAHDRFFMRQVADEFWLVSQGQLERHTETLDEVLALDAPAHRDSDDNSQRPSGTAAERRAQRAAEREALKPLTREVKDIERKLSKLSRELDDLSAELADSERYAAMSNEEISERIARHGSSQRRKDELEERWLELSEQIEARGSD